MSNDETTPVPQEMPQNSISKSFFKVEEYAEIIMQSENINASIFYLNEYAESQHKRLQAENERLLSENKEWKVECERLAGIADFWQKKYYELNPPQQPPKIDNL